MFSSPSGADESGELVIAGSASFSFSTETLVQPASKVSKKNAARKCHWPVRGIRVMLLNIMNLRIMVISIATYGYCSQSCLNRGCT